MSLSRPMMIAAGLPVFLSLSDAKAEKTSVVSSQCSQTSRDLAIHSHKKANGHTFINCLDSDGDSLPDQVETILSGTDPNNPDTDGDGYSDGDEVDLRFRLEFHNPNGCGTFQPVDYDVSVNIVSDPLQAEVTYRDFTGILRPGKDQDSDCLADQQEERIDFFGTGSHQSGVPESYFWALENPDDPQSRQALLKNVESVRGCIDRLLEPTADLDGDGLPNIIECIWTLGESPTDAETSDQSVNLEPWQLECMSGL